MKQYRQLTATRGIAGRSNTDCAGFRAQAAREHAGLTQESVAAKLGITVPLLRNLELGKKHIGDNEYHVMARLYGVSYMWLAIGDQTSKDRWPEWWVPPP